MHAPEIDGRRRRRAFVGQGFNAASGCNLDRSWPMAPGALDAFKHAWQDVGAEAVGWLPNVSDGDGLQPGGVYEHASDSLLTDAGSPRGCPHVDVVPSPARAGMSSCHGGRQRS